METETEHPKVFVSHASEDKERFVLNFATRLRKRGIDAWGDGWEMLPGDSLIDKIFEEGIKSAQAMIVVLSRFSVEKPWVREELNAGMVKRIEEERFRIIPVVIDDCEVPVALRSTLWQRIEDLQDYDQELDRLVAAIYCHSQKPPLGPPPRYAQLRIDNLPGLTRTDTLVLKAACEASLEAGRKMVGMDQLVDSVSELGISKEAVAESVQMLDDRSFVSNMIVTGGGNIRAFAITTHGFESFAKAFLPGFDEVINQSLVSIVNHDLKNSEAVAAHLNKSETLVKYALEVLANRGFLKVFWTGGGGILVQTVTVKGKRAARNL
jgi:hypothetical protein